MQINPYSIFIILCGVILISLSIYACLHRKKPGAYLFSIFLSALGLYTLAYSMELASTNLPTMLFWNRVEYLGILTFPSLYLIFVLQYTGHQHWLTRRFLILLFSVPAIAMLLKLTDGVHHLVYTTTRVNPESPIPLLVFTPGVGYWIYAIFNSLCIIAGILLLWQHRRRALSVYRREINFMLVVATLPMMVYVFYLARLDLVPQMQGLDYNPFFYTIWGACVFWGMFHFRVFDLVPIARDALVENLPDGVLILDINFQVADANPAAQRIFGWKSSRPGVNLRSTLPGFPTATHAIPTNQTFESCLNGKGTKRYYDVDLSVLNDQRCEPVGQLVVLHDVTRRKEIERELQHAKEAAEMANAELREAWSELDLIAGTDKLTGVFNRRKFEEYILKEIDRANRYTAPLSLAILDIDHFKEINDQFGHDAGDRVLIELVRVIAINMRKFDLIVRWGGDEFILLTPGQTSTRHTPWQNGSVKRSLVTNFPSRAA